ncbi:hypothetical protein O7635_11485 [Asanoa sp. WMMD1127]|uniref:hypothetical protein n=1 Tax=Asanoa sp. WMMD1127 TaxID=3016107 RepID=UPI002416487A|nr:hypothetical protein [Asanoa sp. WMMD1127]MDG4822472.1 hypothetical protein [Asanoa sp. WMMD1127]
MAQVEIDDETNSYLEFAANLTGQTKGQVVAQLVARSRLTTQPEAVDGSPSTVKIHCDYNGFRTKALFHRGPGRIEIEDGPLKGRAFRSPSEAAREVVRHYNPAVSPHRNGWVFWVVTATGKQLQTIRP